MVLTIDNNDGAGGVDYTQAVLKTKPLTITRARGAWTRCECGLDVLGAGLACPVNRARVTVTDAAGAVLFAGFAVCDAMTTGSGSDTLPMLVALESEWLTETAPGDALTAGTVHALESGEGKLTRTAVTAARVGDLASDVTVSGTHEAAAYVTELFRGDGTTAVFKLAHEPFRESGVSTLVMESFDDAALNAAVWTKTDPGGFLSPGAGGFTMTGGTGVDGATVLSFASPVEAGGTLVAEASSLMLASGSDGVLVGFYSGAVSVANCVAGVRVTGTGGAQALNAVVNGVVQPTAYAFTGGHSYALRVRLHCAEVQRVHGTYEALVDGVLQTFGGDVVDAPLHVVIEAVDLGLASSTLPSVLYDGAMASSPGMLTFAPVNSIALVGSVGSVSLVQNGSCWVTETATDGTVTTMREGAAGSGADVALTTTGVLSFAAGRVPGAGSLLTVTYRKARRAVARMRDADAVELKSEYALPGLPSWSGRVANPAARSSVDCANAAAALLALADGAATAKPGTVEWVRGGSLAEDVQAGDVISMGELLLPIESVVLTDGGCEPEVLNYRAAFDQSRMRNLSFRVEEKLASDVAMPVSVTASTASLPASLAGLQVTSATSSALQIDSGVDPVSGGGFEVRRSDANFGSASTSDLVLQSPVRSFSIPRTAFAERFFVRMYDGSSPRRYSAVSSIVFTSLPTS